MTKDINTLQRYTEEDLDHIKNYPWDKTPSIEEVKMMLSALPEYPWLVDPDDRPDGYEWNNHIIQLAKSMNTICFMAHSGKKNNTRLQVAAQFIAKSPEIVQDLIAENERLEKLVYISGLFQCKKCNFRVVSKNLSMANSGVSGKSAEQCPNCNVPMTALFKDY